MTELPSTLTYFGSLSTISQVLTKSSLPLLKASQLQDPFLPDACSGMPFTAKDLFDTSVKYIAGAIFGKTAPRGQPNHPLQKAIMRWRMENRFNDELEVKEALQGLLPAMVDKSFGDAMSVHMNWIQYVSSMRIVPFYERFQELDIWETKGLALKGAAIKFKCLEDSIFSQCSPANYKKIPAVTVDVMAYVEEMTGVSPEVEHDYKEVLLTQNYVHRKDKEWRMLVNESVEPSIAFPAELIKSVYLGAQVSDVNVDKLTKHLAKLYPQVNVYQAKCKTREYDLEFVRLNETPEETEEDKDKD